MFEFDKGIVQTLLTENEGFKVLYRKHRELNDRVDEAGSGERYLDDEKLRELKKARLQTRDRLAAIIQQHRQTSH